MKPKTINELFKLRYEKWDKLPDIIGVYNSEQISEKSSAFADFLPKFDPSVYRALNKEEITLEDISEIVLKIKTDAENVIGQNVMYYKRRFKEKYFLVTSFGKELTQDYLEEGFFTFNCNDDYNSAYKTCQHEIKYLNNREEAIESSKTIAKDINSLPKDYFL